MKPRTAVRKISKKKLAQLNGRIPFSSISSPRKAVRKSNPIATKKRRARKAKRMRGAEYRAARAGAMERSGGRCEHVTNVHESTRYPAFVTHVFRCPETERLQFHEEHYARGRILTADDGKMFCPPHHRLAESLKPHKWHKAGF